MEDTFLKRGFLFLSVVVCTFMLFMPSSSAQTPSVAVNSNNIRSGTMHGPIGPFKSLEDARIYLQNQGIQMAQNFSPSSMNTFSINPNAILVQPSANAGTFVPPACCSGTPWDYQTTIALGIPDWATGMDMVKEAGYISYNGIPGQGAHTYNAVWSPDYIMDQNNGSLGIFDHWWLPSQETINTPNMVSFYATIDAHTCSAGSCYYPPMWFIVSYFYQYGPQWWQTTGWVDPVYFGGGFGPPEITYYMYLPGCSTNDLDIDRDGWAVCDGDCNDYDASIHPGASSAGEICTGIDYNCDGIIGENTYLNVPFIDQATPPWGPETYNSTNKTIQNDGCALTSFNMVWNYYFPNYSQTPDTINGILNGIRGGYTQGNFNWLTACKYATGSYNQMCTEAKVTYDPNVIDEELCQGNPVIVEVPGHPSHFVVITGKDSKGNYVMNNPGNSSEGNFSGTYPGGGKSMRIITPIQ